MLLLGMLQHYLLQHDLLIRSKTRHSMHDKFRTMMVRNEHDGLCVALMLGENSLSTYVQPVVLILDQFMLLSFEEGAIQENDEFCLSCK